MTWHFDIFWQHWSHAFCGLRRRFRAPGLKHETAARQSGWRRDPLSHPALQAMSERDLADLPFDPRRIDPD